MPKTRPAAEKSSESLHDIVIAFLVFDVPLLVLPRIVDNEFNTPKTFLERAINDFNGDPTKWSLFYFKGLLAYQTGALFEAGAAFEKALYDNPVFVEAGQQLEEINQVPKDSEKVPIKLR